MAKKKHHQREGDGSDVDRELTLFFGGGYKADAGLRSGLGSQLDRLRFGLGSGGGGDLPDGWNDAVTFDPAGVLGARGWLEQGRVARALTRMQRTADGGQGVEVLRAYYTPHPDGAHRGLEYFEDFAAVALVVPNAVAATVAFTQAQYARELARAAEAVLEAATDSGKRLERLQTELEKNLQSTHPARFLARWSLRKRIAAAETAVPAPDTTAGIRLKWAQPIEVHAAAALRALCRVADGKKDTKERQEAKRALVGILAESKRLWRTARKSYAAERRKVDQEITTSMACKKSEAMSDFVASLEFIPAEAD